MTESKLNNYIAAVLENLPSDWLDLTTHRLDIYDESQAKTQFLEQFESLYSTNNYQTTALYDLPTAYDYIRLGHPLSSVMEWLVAKSCDLDSSHVISFSSRVTPLLAILRKNHLDQKSTVVYHSGGLPATFDADLVRSIYGYQFELVEVQYDQSIQHDGDSTSVYISNQQNICDLRMSPSEEKRFDFYINIDAHLGSILLVNGAQNQEYISEIQHVRRRETIAMTPADCYTALSSYVGLPSQAADQKWVKNNASVLSSVQEITGSDTQAVVASSGLSMQYAIMMGLIHDANIHHPGKDIKFIVPPNCYGGTNDQARRVAACIANVSIIDLPVDRDSDMVQSVDRILDQVAAIDAVPYIIAEIPTNPRVEVPDMQKLKEALGQTRMTADGHVAIEPVFILDQTFCPNTHFLAEKEWLADTKTIAYVSGSKFPSGGRCTAGYCTTNKKAQYLIEKIGLHLSLCDNEATYLQYEILAEQLPSMNQRIEAAYLNTREFVNFIKLTLPEAKINFVSQDLASQGFTPSVFSLDLPTHGDTDQEREANKRALNLKLINLMITDIPQESKYCVSYGQLKGCYWTIPATSTQGTTKEGDKDYIVRAALSAHMDLEKHKNVFAKFVKSI